MRLPAVLKVFDLEFSISFQLLNNILLTENAWYREKWPKSRVLPRFIYGAR